MNNLFNNQYLISPDDELREFNWASKEWVRNKDKSFYMSLKKLIECGHDVESVRLGGKKDNTLLIAASLMGFSDSVRLLLSLPNVDIVAKNKMGQTALDVADNEEIKKLLLDAQGGMFLTMARTGKQR